MRFINNRYMHGRGCSKRHTVGCTDDLSAASGADALDPSLAHSPTPTPGGRTRRTGLLTVMERPPGNLFVVWIEKASIVPQFI